MAIYYDGTSGMSCCRFGLLLILYLVHLPDFLPGCWGLAAGWSWCRLLTLMFAAQTQFPSGEILHTNNIGVVDGTEITKVEFDQMCQTIETNMKQQNKTDNLTTEQNYMVRQQAYQELLNEKLLAGEFSKLGISVGKDELNDMFFGDFIDPMVIQNFSDPNQNYNKQAISIYSTI